MEVNSKVEELKQQFKDAEFQHRIEVGEITEALMNFKEKEKMWEGFVHDNEKVLKGLRIELNIQVEEEPEEPKEVIKKAKRKLKKKSKVIKKLAKPEAPKFVRECQCCTHKKAVLLAEMERKVKGQH